MTGTPVLIRRPGAAWHPCSTVSYGSEDALQTLLQESPDLLPWSNSKDVIVAREFEVPLTGYADLVVVDRAGEISIVECKLQANPEIRRHVIGQLFVYASGLAKMSYEAFDHAFSVRTGKSLVEAMESRSSDEEQEWGAEQFRINVTANLHAGRMGLLIAVDEITEELKRTVEFINSHTTAELRVMALELNLIREEGFEILLPTVYGEESFRAKPSPTRKARWDEGTFFHTLEDKCRPEGIQAFRKIYEHALQSGAGLSWGGGATMPSVSAFYLIDEDKVSVWSCYVHSLPSKPSFDVNFGNMAGRVSEGKLRAFLNNLQSIPGVSERYSNVEAANFNKYPSLGIDEFLTKAEAVRTIIRALDDLITPEILEARETTGP